jgi:hypothetical protein
MTPHQTTPLRGTRFMMISRPASIISSQVTLISADDVKLITLDFLSL